MKLFRALLVIPFVISLLMPAYAQAAIAITASVNQGPIGKEITITGSGFYGATVNETDSRGVSILFGKYPGTVMDYSAAIYQLLKVVELRDGAFQTSVTIPSRLDSGSVKEEVSRGTNYIWLTYFYPAVPPFPSVNGTEIKAITTFTVVAGAITLDPNRGPVGIEVAINGSHFGVSESIAITYDGITANIAGDRDTDANGTFGISKITVPPRSAGTYVITATGNTSGSIAQANFTVTPAISVTPTSGPKGTLITVKGTGFGKNSEFNTTFGSVAGGSGTTDAVGGFAVPIAASADATGNYDITARDAGGNTASASFALTSSGINLTAVSGVGGTAVAVSGTGFITNRALSVTFNDAQVATATSDAQGRFSANFTVPALAAGTYKVKASDGTNTSEADFAISLSTDISPKTSRASPGYVGLEVTITGAGIAPLSTVTVTYDGKEVATATGGANKSFSATFKVPASNAGEHTIVVTTGAGTRQFTFVLESAPPNPPVPLKPEMGINVKPAPSFDWENVADPSGVTYTLQIATAVDFSQAAMVLEKPGLTLSEYTISEKDKLLSTGKNAPYYWHVRAIDGAGNLGQWSGTGTFSVGARLSQPVIYLLIGIGALAVIIVGFWLGRRTAFH